MKIAIIGAGISGLVTAYRLQRDHEITLFEAGSYLGGHTNTIDVPAEGQHFAIDTGFIVFNDRTYPNFIALLDELNVASKPTTMSFSVRCEASGWEYRGADLNGFFAQRSNLINPRFYRFLLELLRFNKKAKTLLTGDDGTLTVGEFFQRESFSKDFIERYFLPMGSAVWSCPRGVFEEFPIQFVIEFYQHHGLLSVKDRPQWRVVEGGSKSYVKAIASKLNANSQTNIHLNSPIQQVTRREDHVEVVPGGTNSVPQTFDHVVFACHSDQALRILGDQATAPERELLGAFPYEKNIATLHTDISVLPRQRRAWGCWNYHSPREDSGKASVTYNMNMLQGLAAKETYCVTLNGEAAIEPSKIIRTIHYEHPIFTVERSAAQLRHAELLGSNRSSFCGAYWGNGFHEDGVNSAIAVVEKLTRNSKCTVVSTTDTSDTDDSSPSKTVSAIESV